MRLEFRTPGRVAPLVLTALLLTACAAPQPPAPTRVVVTTANQLPRTQLTLPVLPSELFALPPAQLQPVLDQLAADVADEARRYDVRDRATLDGYSAARVAVALLGGRFADVPALTAEWRARQEKPAAAATTAVLSEAAAAARAGGGDLAAQRQRFRARLAALLDPHPWAVVSNNVKSMKGLLELNNPVVTQAGVKSRLDPPARNNQLRLDRGSVAGVLSQRAFIEHVLPFREDAIAVLQDYVTRNDRPVADTWTPRTFALRPDAPARPVVVAVWDSGVDPALFRMAAPVAGVGFDLEARPTSAPLEDIAQSPLPWSQTKGLMRGARDVFANVESPEASAYRRQVAGLRPEQVQPFQESMRLGGNYYHGTHVAGIAVDGNPFARVFNARITFGWRTEPLPITDERRERAKAAYRATVAAMRAAGVRVANMSFGGTQRGWEASLQFHGVGRNAEERRELARRYFMEAREAMRDALASAPEILFVTSAGNADSDSGFEETSPADIALPNLITVGAVDSAGQETSFSSFGRTTVIHANGYQVDSFMPGGDRLRASGTSMSAPQIANLAAKLLALYPDLSVAELRQLILDGAERNGRVNLAHPRRTLELAAQRRPAGPRPADVVAR